MGAAKQKWRHLKAPGMVSSQQRVHSKPGSWSDPGQVKVSDPIIALRELTANMFPFPIIISHQIQHHPFFTWATSSPVQTAGTHLQTTLHRETQRHIFTHRGTHTHTDTQIDKQLQLIWQCANRPAKLPQSSTQKLTKANLITCDPMNMASEWEQVEPKPTSGFSWGPFVAARAFGCPCLQGYWLIQALYI